MELTTTSKSLMACILTVLVVLPFISASFLNATDTRASSVAEGTISQPTSTTPQPRTVMRTFAPFWRIGNGYSSALIIRNTSQQLSASATPIVFTTDATPTWLPAIQLAPGEVKRVYLEEALPAERSSAQTGALAIQIDQSQSPTVIGEVVVTNYQQGIIFDIPLHAGYAGSETKTLHSSWWLPDDKTEGTLVLFNASERAIVAHPSIKTNFSQHSFGDVSLAAHESKKLDLREMIRQTEDRNADTGSITISYEGPQQALLPTILLFNTKNGFSFTGRFFPRHLQQPNLASRVNWYYPIVVTGKADVSLGFLKESKFTAYALISNPTNTAITPHLTATFTAETGATQASSLVIDPLAPGTSSLVDLSELAKKSMPNGVSSFSLQVSHEGAIGDLAIDIFSVDQKKDFVFTAEGTTALRTRLDSIYWNIADDLQSMLVVENTGDNSVETQATLVYDTSDGRREEYKLPPLLMPARATRIVNLRQIITAGQPDETGQVIPPGITFGTVTIEPVAGQHSDALVGGNFTFDPDAGTCGGDGFPICSKEDQEFGLCDLIPIIIICIEFCGSDPPITITITKADGSELASPFRVGISSTGYANCLTNTPGQSHNRTQHLKATVSPASEAAFVTVSVSGNLTESNLQPPASGVVMFDVVGNTKSTNRGDASITVTHPSNVTVTKTVSVVVPGQIGTPHDTSGGGLVSQNVISDCSTVLPPGFQLPSGSVALLTIYVRFLSIVVQDQLGDAIGDIYQGAEVAELVGSNWIPINQKLTSSGTYPDPVGEVIPVDLVPRGSSDANSWPSMPLTPMQPTPDPVDANASVQIDGFTLTSGIGNRTWKATPPSTLTITWP